ncbi:RNA polymerase sigma factor [Alkaliphilus metalliredigens]|uniref:RNA polymerase sigma factor n=1 Tax=Alkaliphilus metalliredigens TaxID=208226 RepID=UPI00005CADA4|nr:sigma-70 family RNA polymerase sigma factor [Alkaliphilus metalliredigens]
MTDDYDKVTPIVSVIEPMESQEEILEKQELKANILKQINHLNSHYKEVIVLYYYVELSYEEIDIFYRIRIWFISYILIFIGFNSVLI